MKLKLNYSHDGKLEGFEFEENELVHLTREVSALRVEVKTIGERIMSAISDFSDKVNAAFDAIGKSVDGVVSDVTELKALIVKLQSTQGQITAEDQALLDKIETRVDGIVTKTQALDDQTAPTEVPTPTPGA